MSCELKEERDMDEQIDSAEIHSLVKKLSLRLEQARRISNAAEACVTDEEPGRALNLLENVEELVRDANHLVQAALIMRYPETEEQQETASCN